MQTILCFCGIYIHIYGFKLLFKMKRIKTRTIFLGKEYEPEKNTLVSIYNLLTQMYCRCAITVGIHNTISGGVHQNLTHLSMTCRQEVSRNQWERFISQSLPPADGQARTAALFRSGENDKFISTLHVLSKAFKITNKRHLLSFICRGKNYLFVL